MKKIAFFGTPPFTVRFLDALYDAGYLPSLIVTNPDRPAGRGMKLAAPEPKQWGAQYGIRVLQPERLDDEFFTTLSAEPWDLFVVVAYGSIIPERVITLPVHGTINVHYSLLPKYRGATPVESAILHGDEHTGVCIQQMRFKLDTGPILMQEEVPITTADTTPSLREKLNDRAVAMLPAALDGIFAGTIAAQEQDESQASHCRKISKEDGLVTLSDDPVLLDRKFRAYQPWPGISFIAQKDGRDIRVKVTQAHLEAGRFVLDTIIPENGKPLSGSGLNQWLA